MLQFSLLGLNSTSVTPSRRALLAELSSSDDSSSSEDNSIQVTKAVQSHVAHISSNEEEPSEDRVHETSEAELQHISSEDEEESKIAMEMPIQRHPPEKTKKRNLSEMQNIQVEAENTTKKAKKSKRNKSPPKPEQSPIKKKHKHKSKKWNINVKYGRCCVIPVLCTCFIKRSALYILKKQIPKKIKKNFKKCPKT